MELLTDKQREQIKLKVDKIPSFLKNKVFILLFFETLGTLILSFGISVSEYNHPISRKQLNPFWTFLISCFNFLAISISGPFSGGHVNPSVTIGLITAKLVKVKSLYPYLGSQIVGAIVGVLIYFAFFLETPQIYSLTPTFGQVILDGLGQTIGTFFFVFGVIYVCERDYVKGQQFKYFFISLMLLVGRTKGCLNPAIAISFQIFAAISHHNFLLLLSVFGMVIGQILGGILAAIFYNKFYNPLLTELQRKID